MSDKVSRPLSIASTRRRQKTVGMLAAETPMKAVASCLAVMFQVATLAMHRPNAALGSCFTASWLLWQPAKATIIADTVKNRTFMINRPKPVAARLDKTVQRSSKKALI